MSRKYFEEMTKEERKETVQNILEVLKRDNFMVINNHNDEEEQIEAMIVLKDDRVAQYVLSRYQSLNELVIAPKDGRVRISTWSVAGTLIGDRFEEYNKSVSIDRFKIKTIYWKDGRVEEVA